MKLREKPCERCGWKFPGFHICVDLSAPCAQENQLHPPRPKATRSYPNGLSEAHVTALNEGRTQRWLKHRAKHSERDAQIVQRYKDGLSFPALAKEFDIAYQTARGVIHRAAEEGLVVVRPKHYTISRPGKDASN